MKKHALAALLAAVALTLASCGGNAGGGEGGDMQDMDHGESGDTRASQQTTLREETTGGGMADMDHSNMGQEETSPEDVTATPREMVMPNGEYSDRAFIDAMVPHHEGAVEMAQIALERAEHEEIRNVAEDIVSSQRAEIELFGEIREREYGSAEPTTEMNEMDMRAMGMSDPRELAQADPFDKAFIDEMVPHHEAAIAMSKVAQEETEDPEIRRIANDIVNAQEREIEQMKQWRQQWYPEG